MINYEEEGMEGLRNEIEQLQCLTSVAKRVLTFLAGSSSCVS